jgi:hypothetical protein
MGNAISENIKTLWAGWTRLARQIGIFQANVLLTILYVVVLLPFGIGVRLFADLLRTIERPSKWLPYPEQSIDMRWAHKQ